MTHRIDLSDLFEEDNIDSIKTALTAAAGLTSNRKVSRVLAGTSVALGIGRTVWRWNRARTAAPNFRIRIAETDPLYKAVQEWIIDSLPMAQQKNLIIASRQSSSGWTDRPSGGKTGTTIDPKIKVLDAFYDGERRQEVVIGNHKVWVNISGGEEKQSKANSRTTMTSTRAVLIDCPTLEARDAVLETLRDEARKAFVRSPKYMTATKWGGFNAVSDIPVRPLETVVLREGQRDYIVGEVRTFLSKEDDYVRMGTPWHTGLLLYGPPGSGKTSIASAIAHSLGLDVYTIPLSSVEDDSSLFDMMDDVKPNSILLLEDVDVASAATTRDDERRGVTLSGLLNCLDGMATPHGIITIMTTNHFDTLDEALFRPGRVDNLEEIGYVDDYQAKALCMQFIGHVPEGMPFVSEEYKIVAAEFVGVFKRNLDTPEKNGPDIIDTINRAVARTTGEFDLNVSKTEPDYEGTTLF